jgi:hypothetical protein
MNGYTFASHRRSLSFLSQADIISSPPSKGVRLPVLGTPHNEARPIQDVGVDHRRRDVAVPEQFLR